MRLDGIGRARPYDFLSYDSADKWYAEHIARDLTEHGRNIFFAERDIKPGERIFDTLIKNLKSCDRFYPLISRNSLRSKWVLKEIFGA